MKFDFHILASCFTAMKWLRINEFNGRLYRSFFCGLSTKSRNKWLTFFLFCFVADLIFACSVDNLCYDTFSMPRFCVQVSQQGIFILIRFNKYLNTSKYNSRIKEMLWTEWTILQPFSNALYISLKQKYGLHATWIIIYNYKFYAPESTFYSKI